MSDIVRYINLSADAGGDGTTNAESSGDGTHAYNSLSAWDAAENTNLVSDGDTHTVHCDKGSSSVTDTTAMSVSGWTTGASNTITITGNRSSSTGFNDTTTFDETSFFAVEKGTASGYAVNVQENYVTIDGLQFVQESAAVNSRYVLGITNDQVVVKNCRFKKNAGGSNARAVFQTAGGSDDFECFNNVFEDYSNSADDTLFVQGAGAKVYNNTFYNCGNALSLHTSLAGSEVVDIKNNVFANNAGSDVVDNSTSTAITFDYNAADDAIGGSNLVDLDDNAGSEWDDSFTNRGTGDFSVKDASSPLYDAGVGNATDASVPTTDILGNTRTTDDIGAFAFVAGGGSSTATFTPAGGVSVAGTAGTSNDFNSIPDGGMALSGAAGLVMRSLLAVSGGAQFGGESAVSSSRELNVSGGYTFAGEAGSAASREFTPAGGLACAGSTSLLGARMFAPDGGVAFSGAAGITTAVPQVEFVPSGGVSFSGRALADGPVLVSFTHSVHREIDDEVPENVVDVHKDY